MSSSAGWKRSYRWISVTVNTPQQVIYWLRKRGLHWGVSGLGGLCVASRKQFNRLQPQDGTVTNNPVCDKEPCDGVLNRPLWRR